MRRFIAAGTLLVVLAVAGYGIRSGVFAQDATPIGDSTPIAVEPQTVGTPLPEPSNGVTLVFVERATSDTTIDLGPDGESLGDVLAFANEVYDETNTTLAGTDQGWCVLTRPGDAYECSWTLTLGDGQIMVQGPYLNEGASALTITGGTGVYVGVTGELTVRVLSEEEIEFTYELQ